MKRSKAATELAVSVIASYSAIPLQVKDLRAFRSPRSAHVRPLSYRKRHIFSLIGYFLCLFKDLAAPPIYIDAICSQSDVPTTYQPKPSSAKATQCVSSGGLCAFWVARDAVLIVALEAGFVP